MIKKDKVFELRIEEDDEVSGIDSISLVDDPAIEINWMYFNKVRPQEFHIPDGEDNKYLEKLKSIAQDEQELFDEGWVISKIIPMGKEGFAVNATQPNAPSEEDEKEYNVRYKYVLNPEAQSPAIIPTTRDFCRELIQKNYVWRLEDMDAQLNDEGDPAIVWRGGYNCRHIWARIEYTKDATIINKASVNKGKIDPQAPLDTRVLGLEQPDTRVPANPSFSKEKYEDECPEATQDIKVNLENRQKAIDQAQYGPLNPNEPNEKYWQNKADSFGGDLAAAKKALCGNCAFFIRTDEMIDCIEEGIGIDPELIISAGEIGYCEAFDFKCAAKRTCSAWVVGGPITEESEYAEVGPKGGIVGSDKAPKSDTKNPDPKGEGSAKGDASGKRGATVTAAQEKTLQGKVDDFNKKESNTKNGNATLGALKSVFQRGLGAYNTSRSPVVRSAEQWAYARVNAFLYLLKNGRPENPKYTTDYDLLPNKHPKANMSSQKLIECKKCGHSWDMEDGGDEPYMCNKCDYDNTEEYEMGYDVSTIGGYQDPNVKKKKKKIDMESYSDYPESVRNNAKAVLKYVDENGWGSCGTPVGKQRANDLAQGNPVSLDTVKRMYSYLSRHEVDLESSKSYDDGCGKLMYDSWGGKSALSWSQSKINQAEKMSKQKFQIDSEEKRVLVGPAMVPNLRIFRKTKDGQPYEVFFSAETIKMIMEKYMKNQYTRNNDLMHDGTAVKDVYVIESWIKEDMEDKSNKYGYGDLPNGTWFVAMKVAKTPEGDKVWNMVKSGELAGFSVSGWFEEVAAFCREEMFLQKVVEILKKYE